MLSGIHKKPVSIRSVTGQVMLMLGAVTQVMRRCNTVRALFPFPITQAPGDLLEAPLQEGLQHARDQGLCPAGCRVVVMAENLADGPDTLPVLFTRVRSSRQ